MPRVCDVMPLLDVDGIVGALTAELQDVGSGALYCPCAAPTQGFVSCTYMSSGLGRIAFVGVIVNCLFLAGACGAFCHLSSVAMACLLLALLMLTGLTGCACLAIVVLWGMKSTWFSNVLPLLLCVLGMQACAQEALTP